jgi:hypothetical protein
MLARVSMLLLKSTIVLGCIGLFLSNVAPSLLAQRVGMVGSILVAVYFFVAFLKPRSFFPKWNESIASQGAGRLAHLPWVRGTIMGLVGLMMAYASLTAALPWLYTCAFGQRGEAYFVVAGWEDRRRGSCSRPRMADQSFPLFSRRAFCFGDALRYALDVGSEVRVVGLKSPLGIVPEQLFPPANKPMEPTR